MRTSREDVCHGSRGVDDSEEWRLRDCRRLKRETEVRSGVRRSSVRGVSSVFGFFGAFDVKTS